jgi:hypothetical protein
MEPKLTDHHKYEAIKRCGHGEETLAEIGHSYNGVVTLLKEEYENSASRIFSNDRDRLVPHVHGRTIAPPRKSSAEECRRVARRMMRGGCLVNLPKRRKY